MAAHSPGHVVMMEPEVDFECLAHTPTPVRTKRDEAMPVDGL